MSKRTRRQFTGQQKVEVVKRHLIDGVAVSQLCEEYQIQPTQFYLWQKQLFEISSGSVEGMNTKAKVALRKSYGFKTFEVYETVLYHELGRLPEPDIAHRFC